MGAPSEAPWADNRKTAYGGKRTFAAVYPAGTLHLLYRDRPEMATDPKDPQADVADTVMLYVETSASQGR